MRKYNLDIKKSAKKILELMKEERERELSLREEDNSIIVINTEKVAKNINNNIRGRTISSEDHAKHYVDKEIKYYIEILEKKIKKEVYKILEITKL